MSEHSPFLSVFPGCEDLKNYAGGLEKAYVTDVQVDAAEMTLTVCAWFSAMPSPVEVTGLTERLKADYGIAGGKGKGLLFKKGQVLGTYPYAELCDRLVELIERDGEQA